MEILEPLDQLAQLGLLEKQDHKEILVRLAVEEKQDRLEIMGRLVFEEILVRLI
jgi:hypothetical protein